MFAKLAAALEQQLHPETDAEDGFAGAPQRVQRQKQAGIAQLLRRVAERADARQDHPVGRFQRAHVARHRRCAPDVAQRREQRKQVAHAVIHHREAAHAQSTPLVDGI